MKKGLICFILTWVILFSVHAQESNDFTVEVKGYGGSRTVTITKYTGAATELVIPETINDIPVTEIGYAAFQSNKTIVSVRLPENLHVIGLSAFSFCEKLPGILIPQSVNSIAEFAFSQCKNLKNVVIANDDIKIGRRAFLACPVTNKDEMIKKFGAELFR
jgi:hypothetical protein